MEHLRRRLLSVYSLRTAGVSCSPSLQNNILLNKAVDVGHAPFWKILEIWLPVTAKFFAKFVKAHGEGKANAGLRRAPLFLAL